MRDSAAMPSTSPNPPAAGPSLSRRRVITIAAAFAGMPTIGAAAGRHDAGALHQWRGVALGAEASLSLWHPDPAKARRMIALSVAEIARLEAIFSLFRPDSELSRLNRDAELTRPSTELRDLLVASQRMGDLSGGGFDVTIQPLWDLYAAHFSTGQQAQYGPDRHRLDTARRLVDYRAMDVGAGRIAFARQGMRATLNGIAQGYITDRVADMMRDFGFEQVVVELGEIRALGAHPDGRPWRVGIKNAHAPDEIARNVEIVDQAVATSGGYGTEFDPGGRHHHLFDPVTGESARRVLDVTVIGPQATDADALATAIFVAPEDRAVNLVGAFPGVTAQITRLDGTLRQIAG